MKTVLLALLLFCALFADVALVHAQDSSVLITLKKGVVKITAFNSSGGVINKGTGIVVGRDCDSVYILTAFHVVKGAARQEALFFHPDSNNSPNQPVKVIGPIPSRVIRKDSSDLDVGVLRVQLERIHLLHKRFPKMLKGNSYQLKLQAVVTCVGHPLGKDWQASKKDIIALSHYKDFRKLEIEKTALDRGNSGGPLFDDKRLIGMILKIDGNSAIAVKIDPVLHLLKSWGIPTNLAQEPPYEGLDTPRISMPGINRKVTYLTTSFAGLTAGSFAWYLIEKENADEQFKKYNEATSPVDAISSRIQTEKARSRCKIARNTFLSTAGVFAILLGRDLIRSKPRPVCYSLDSHLLNPTKNGLAVGLKSEPDLLALSINVQYNF